MTPIGFKVGGLAVMSLLVACAAHSAAPSAGSVVLSGTYTRRLDPTTRELHGEQVCFFPDADSKGLVPREQGDRRLPWFCFSNRDRAALLLALPSERGCGHSGTATVAVSEYMVDRTESAVFDTARLDRVLTASRPEPLPCTEE
jgi:hypothetical protein